MAPDRPDSDYEPLSPEDVDSAPTSPIADPNEDVPVPAAMSPAEVDERAQVVEKLRRDQSGLGAEQDRGAGREPSARPDSMQ